MEGQRALLLLAPRQHGGLAGQRVPQYGGLEGQRMPLALPQHGG